MWSIIDYQQTEYKTTVEHFEKLQILFFFSPSFSCYPFFSFFVDAKLLVSRYVCWFIGVPKYCCSVAANAARQQIRCISHTSKQNDVFERRKFGSVGGSLMKRKKLFDLWPSFTAVGSKWHSFAIVVGPKSKRSSAKTNLKMHYPIKLRKRCLKCA